MPLRSATSISQFKIDFVKQVLIFLWEVFEIAVIAIVSVIVIRTFIVQPFLVRGVSMEPNFSGGDYLLVDEITLRFREPERGEVVVFRFPRDPQTFYIKRIIGLPEETVSIRDNQITIKNSDYPEGFALNEAYTNSGGLTGGEVMYEMGPGEYLVLGDNRSASYDSRNWGTVPRDNIIGLAKIRLWPIDAVDIIEAPSY